MKKILALLLFISVYVSLFACANESSTLDISMMESSVESNVSEDISVSDGSSISEESSLPEFSAETDLLPVFEGLCDEDMQKALDFFAFVEEKLGTDALEALSDAISLNGYSDSLWYEATGNTIHFLRSLYLGEDKTLDNVRFMSLGKIDSDKNTVLTFGGDVCFGDNYYPMQHLKQSKNGIYDCFDSEWFDIMRSADIAMLNNEFTISDRGSPMPGKLYTFCAQTTHTDYYNDLGVDFVTLANNHAFDYGEDAFYDTLASLDKYGIDYAGGGRNADEAQRPFYYLVDGRKIGFVSATRAEKYILTPEAGENTPGVFRCYDSTRLVEVIGETKLNCDYVVLFIHWGTEYSDVLETVQKTTSHAYIDAGADIIIGSHAHQLQGIEFYKDKPIFYNLGNFWFNGKKIETGLAKLVLSPDGKADYYFLPGLQFQCETSFELGTSLGREIMDRVASYEPCEVIIEDDGRVIPKDADE